MFFKEKCRCKNKGKSASSKKPPLHTPKLNPLNFEIFKRSSWKKKTEIGLFPFFVQKMASVAERILHYF